MHKPTAQLPRRMPHAAFTLHELIIGLVVLSIVGGATAAAALAVSRGWQAGELDRRSEVTDSRVLARLRDTFQRAKGVGDWRDGRIDNASSSDSAAMLIWRDDDNGDELMQLEEVQLIEHDVATGSLVLWEPSFPTASARAAYNGPYLPKMLTDGDAIKDFKLLTYIRKVTITKGVIGAVFNVRAGTASQRRAIEFTLKLNGTSGSRLLYGTAAAKGTVVSTS